jgi:hypothetical protein
MAKKQTQKGNGQLKKGKEERVRRTGKKSQEKIRNQKIRKNQTKFTKHGKNTKNFVV